MSAGPVDDPSRWLVKARGGSGGGHIRPAEAAMPEPGHYLQAHVTGRPYALNGLAAGGTVRALALTEQWCAPAPGRPFRYGGAVARADGEPPPLPPSLVTTIGEAAGRIASATGLAGLFSADFLSDGTEWWLTEINPRPGATLDLLDRRSRPLLPAHLAACLSEGRQIDLGAPRWMRRPRRSVTRAATMRRSRPSHGPRMSATGPVPEPSCGGTRRSAPSSRRAPTGPPPGLPSTSGWPGCGGP